MELCDRTETSKNLHQLMQNIHWKRTSVKLDPITVIIIIRRHVFDQWRRKYHHVHVFFQK